MQEHAKIQGVQPQVVGMQPGTLVSQPDLNITQSPGQDQKYELVPFPLPTASLFQIRNLPISNSYSTRNSNQIAYLQRSPAAAFPYSPAFNKQPISCQVQPIQQPEKVLVTVPFLQRKLTY